MSSADQRTKERNSIRHTVCVYPVRTHIVGPSNPSTRGSGSGPRKLIIQIWCVYLYRRKFGVLRNVTQVQI
jgi:hypothetical protein